MTDNKKGILVLIVLCGLGLFITTRNSPQENSASKENPPVVNPEPNNPSPPPQPPNNPQPPRKPRPGP